MLFEAKTGYKVTYQGLDLSVMLLTVFAEKVGMAFEL
jgi:hypothetical protein